MITDNDKKILDAFYEPVPMGRNDDAVLRKVMNAVKAAAPELFELRAENEKLREALKPFADEFSLYKTDFPDHFYISDLGFTFGQLRAARAAIEGVTEPASPWRDIESAPKDGTEILGCSAYKDKNGNLCYNWAADGYFGGDSNWYFRYFDECNYTEVTHWMPLPIPPANTQTGER